MNPHAPSREAWQPGRSAEWDRCIELAAKLELDDLARLYVARSSLGDTELARFLRDCTDMQPPLKHASEYVMKSIAGKQRERARG